MSSKRTKDQHLVEKVNKLKEKQNQWMKEREDNKNPKKFVHSSLRSTSSSVKSKQSTQDAMKESDTMAWATSNSNYNGFVVRNGSGTSRSRPDSSRTPSNKKTKTFTHSSLKKQTSSKPLSAKSSNFTHS
uniref:Uncharacterized protein n=1 Tax=Clytia hemisphaerica TaxID=252671 RepID=A0A7M5UQ52_9CNID